MPALTTLAVIGSGSLARATCLALSTPDVLRGVPVEVVVIARNAAAATDLCHVSRLRAALLGRPLRFRPEPVDPRDSAAVAGVLGRDRPAGVLICASTQSPWEHAGRPSAWTELLRHAGIGLALPFHTEIALAVARAARDSDAFLVNACFPDAVNPLLAVLGAPVLAGVGNAGLIAAALQSALGLNDQSRLRVLAHHLHLHRPADPGDDARAWLDGVPLADVASLLDAQRAADRRGLNDVTGLLAADLLADVLTKADRDTHLPGVAGRPGGYPVRISGGSLTLRLPADVDEEWAVRVNERWGAQEGVTVHAGGVRFSGPVTAALTPLLPGYAEGFSPAQFTDVRAALHAARERLRAEPVH